MVAVLIYADLHFGLRCAEHRCLFYAYGRRRCVMTMGWTRLSGGGGLEAKKMVATSYDATEVYARPCVSLL